VSEKDLLSKKELLSLTGISYGQLYRWKRQNLIPESWFIKQASFTGQETFFPRDEILKRVSLILELKDQYSLEDLADLLSPELTNRSFQSGELKNFPGVEPDVIELFGKNSFSFIEFIFIYILSQIYREFNLNRDEILDMTVSIQSWLPGLKGSFYRLVVCNRESQTFLIILNQDATVFFDHKTKELRVFYLDELSKDLKLKLNALIDSV
jgi:hypothetical protein